MGRKKVEETAMENIIIDDSIEDVPMQEIKKNVKPVITEIPQVKNYA